MMEGWKQKGSKCDYTLKQIEPFKFTSPEDTLHPALTIAFSSLLLNKKIQIQWFIVGWNEKEIRN